ncbi:hypothetical protein [Roseicyclus mahoneyensis]|uniref:Uncharacterized protein n=1 Tax=Roseicyclus mahoneyensis TaxID=164332 RepID=A0A316GML6_9RHOB|nr:hypothetical protein [Roseicyclus mahoneyensis]PWK61179.1 hypothetical protein C7455_103381 [Roseicyclus mahoneyensis]
MNVSHFELIFKPQSPVPPADTVLQGYFLSITNLEDVALSFRLDFVTSSITDPTRTLSGNTLVIVDIAGDNNDFTYSLLGGPAAKSFRLSPLLKIPAHATAKVAVLPSDPFPPPIGDGTADPADYEARGYVTLRLPALIETAGKEIKIIRQLDRPANVLLTPQNRATYFRDGKTIESQTQSSLPLASGSALNEVPAERRPFLELAIDPKRKFDLGRLLREIDIDLVPDLLADLMVLAQASGIDTKAFNSALKDAGIGMALERRQVAVEAAE